MEKEVLQSVAQYLGQWFRPPLPVLITVTHVRMPGDLRTAKVYVSLLFNESASGNVNGTPREIEETLKSLQAASAECQHHLAQQLKSRFCPKLTFYQDESTEHVLRVEKILQDLKLEHPTSDREAETSPQPNQKRDHED